MLRQRRLIPKGMSLLYFIFIKAQSGKTKMVDGFSGGLR